MRRSVSVGVVLSLVFLGTYLNPAPAHAQAVNLNQTGQTICYDTEGKKIPCAGTGQDGDVRAGVPWPAPRFVNVGDGTAIDSLTGLIWSKDANVMLSRDPGFDQDWNLNGPDGLVLWENALAYIKLLNAQAYLGRSDWRMPNILELESLSNMDMPHNGSYLSWEGFQNVCDYYPTSTSGGFPAPDSFWTIGATEWNLGWGGKRWNYTCVWPVRGESAQVPATGQSFCADVDGNPIGCAGTGQDGDLRQGVAWNADTRFADQGDGTMLDTLTGLVWTRQGDAPGPEACAPGVAKTWQESLDYVKCLNNAAFLGRQDWRLPNRREMLTLVQYEEIVSSCTPAGDMCWFEPWLNHHGFVNVQPGVYWTSTSMPEYPENAWSVYIGSPYVTANYKDDLAIAPFAWPVAGGNRGTDRVAAVVKVPEPAKKVSGNEVHVVAELILGTPAATGGVRFQYKTALSEAWLDIPTADPNPDVDAPYFVHWDVRPLPDGEYHVRAVATSRGGLEDANVPLISIFVDNP